LVCRRESVVSARRTTASPFRDPAYNILAAPLQRADASRRSVLTLDANLPPQVTHIKKFHPIWSLCDPLT